MSKQKPTSAEHFIPQFYLKQFSPDNKFIYQYDVVAGKQTPVAVPIRSICFEKNLYEFQDNAGRFVYQNLIEKTLSAYEGLFANTFRSIISKTQFPANFRTLSFLSTQERIFLIIFLSTLILRHPDILNAGIETAKESFGKEMEQFQAKNLTLKMCLPIYKMIDPNEKTILNVVFSWFENMSFQIYVSDKDVFFTCDHPAVIIGSYSPHHIEELYFPISPRIMLHMMPEDDTPKHYRNRMLPLSDKEIKIITREYSAHCRRWVYSKSPLSEQQIRMIDKGRCRT